MASFDDFLGHLVISGLEHFRKFYGTYRAQILSNLDPEKRGRVQLFVPETGQTKPTNFGGLPWVDPAVDYAGKGHGTFFPPEVGDTVWVAFDRGNPSYPKVYWGGWYPVDAVPKALGYDTGGNETVGPPPIKRGIVTKAGHILVFNDKDGAEQVQLSWSKTGGSKTSSLSFNPNGNVVITDAEKTTVTLDAEKKQFTIVDASSNKVTMKDKLIQIEDKSGNLISIADGKIQITAKDSVTVKTKKVDVQADTVMLAGDSDKVPLGQQLLNWLTTHTHGTGVGVSSPALQPAIPMQLLSQKVKLS